MPEPLPAFQSSDRKPRRPSHSTGWLDMANSSCDPWGDPKTLRVRQSLMGETPKTTLTHRTASETSPSPDLKLQNPKSP
jgi:hypothetical protein